MFIYIYIFIAQDTVAHSTDLLSLENMFILYKTVTRDKDLQYLSIYTVSTDLGAQNQCLYLLCKCQILVCFALNCLVLCLML